jgi:hypothetical protein
MPIDAFRRALHELPLTSEDRVALRGKKKREKKRTGIFHRQVFHRQGSFGRLEARCVKSA